MPDAYEQLLQMPAAQLVSLALDGLTLQGQALGQVFRSAGDQLGILHKVDRVRQIYLAGCGDSYFAALSTRTAFERFTGLPAIAVEALELAYFTALGPGSLVILISFSGDVRLTLEAGRAARQTGAQVIGVTASAGSRMAQEFPCLVIDPGLSAGSPASLPAMMLGNFSFSLAALYRTALHLGLSRRLSGAAAEDIEAEIERIPRAVERAMESAGQVKKYIGQVSDASDFYFLGAGPSYGTALFYQAKFFEQAQRPVFGVQMEEFAHEQFFLLRPERDAQVWFLAPSGSIQRRALEVMAACKAMGARVVVVSAAQDQQILEQAGLALSVDYTLEFFSPLATAPLGQLLGLFAFERWGSSLPAPALRYQQMSVSKRLTRC